MLSAETRWETQIQTTQEKDKWIKDYVDTEAAVSRRCVQGAETAIMQEQEDIKTAENAQSTSRKPETTFK